LMYVSLFCISGFHGTERFDKPFNPVIGETFEFIQPENNMKFLAEQVSHKPPISVCHMENENFASWQQGIFNVRFMGNSLDLDSTGSKGFISLPKTADLFAWTTPRTTVHNCLVGKVWLDHWGLMPIKNSSTGDKCEIKWKRCGWFGANRWEVEGDIIDKDGNVQMQVFGKWNKELFARWLFDGGLHPKGTTVCLWTKDPTQIGRHKQTPYALLLKQMDEDLEQLLPPTDSRLRLDRKHLEKGDLNRAGAFKLEIEERQRAQENARKARNDPWVPKWFTSVPDETIEGSMWIYKGNYWEERESKKELLASGDRAEANQLLAREGIQGLACNFLSYPPRP